MRTLICTLLLLGLISPASYSQKAKKVPRAQPVAPQPTPAASAASAPVTPPAGGGATLRPGDMFEMNLSGMPIEDREGFAKAYTVGQDGLVNIPYAGYIRAAGLTQSQLEQAIQRKLIDGKIFSFPTVTIVMGGGQVRYITIGGQVRNPNRFLWSPDLTLVAAISAAGGVGDFGGDKVTLTRGGEKKQYSLKRLKRTPAEDPRLLPGDLVDAL